MKLPLNVRGNETSRKPCNLSVVYIYILWNSYNDRKPTRSSTAYLLT